MDLGNAKCRRKLPIKVSNIKDLKNSQEMMKVLNIRCITFKAIGYIIRLSLQWQSSQNLGYSGSGYAEISCQISFGFYAIRAN
jgi:hypothetical protein